MAPKKKVNAKTGVQTGQLTFRCVPPGLTCLRLSLGPKSCTCLLHWPHSPPSRWCAPVCRPAGDTDPRACASACVAPACAPQRVGRELAAGGPRPAGRALCLPLPHAYHGAWRAHPAAVAQHTGTGSGLVGVVKQHAFPTAPGAGTQPTPLRLTRPPRRWRCSPSSLAPCCSPSWAAWLTPTAPGATGAAPLPRLSLRCLPRRTERRTRVSCRLTGGQPWATASLWRCVTQSRHTSVGKGGCFLFHR